MRFERLLLAGLLCASTAFAADGKITELNKETAEKIAAKAFACGVKNNWKFSVAIVNAEGNLLHFQRADGAYPGSITAAIEKAKSSNNFQRATSAFAQSLKEGRAGLVTMPGIIALEGGVQILADGKHIGAIGLSGARGIEDEQCANEAAGSKPAAKP